MVCTRILLSKPYFIYVCHIFLLPIVKHSRPMFDQISRAISPVSKKCFIQLYRGQSHYSQTCKACLFCQHFLLSKAWYVPRILMDCDSRSALVPFKATYLRVAKVHTEIALSSILSMKDCLEIHY